jgi:hypothetical protein
MCPWRLRLSAQRFDSAEQLAFADVLRYNPWHSPEHKPLGNSNRARRQMYWELAQLRQTMNGIDDQVPPLPVRLHPSAGESLSRALRADEPSRPVRPLLALPSRCRQPGRRVTVQGTPQRS